MSDSPSREPSDDSESRGDSPTQYPSTHPGGVSIRPFTAGQRRALAAVLLVFIALLAISLLRNTTHIDDPMPDQGARFDQLADRLDPNVADVESLSALPQLGARRARDIVDYRERLRAADPNRVAFTKLEDLLKIRGIGAAMIRHVEPFLTFPATNPATTTKAS